MSSVLRSIRQTPSKFLVAVTTVGYYAATSGTEDAGDLVLSGSRTAVGAAGVVWIDMGKVQLISGGVYLKIGRNITTSTPTIGYIELSDGLYGNFQEVVGWARL